MPAPLHVLAFAAHPDDVELSAGGTLCKLANAGYRVGIVDFTRGELGSRGTPEGRLEEAAEAGRIMGLAARENLGLPDGDIENSKRNQERVIETLRRYRPHIVLVNAAVDRHPDHGAAHRLAMSAIFYSGLRKVETAEQDGSPQEPWRPHHILQYMQTTPFEPTLVVDVGDVWEQRTRALLAFRSQIANPNYTPAADEPQTFVSNPMFFRFIEARAQTFGYSIGATHGEGFRYEQTPLGVSDLVAFLDRERVFR